MAPANESLAAVALGRMLRTKWRRSQRLGVFAMARLGYRGAGSTILTRIRISVKKAESGTSHA